MKDVKTTADLESILKSKFQTSLEENKEEFYRYVMYVRKSTDEDGKQERSLNDQKQECKELRDRLNLKIVKIYEESVSAKEPDIRPKFREMLDKIIEGKYDGIIAYHPNRLSRNMREAGEIIDLLDKGIIKDLKFPSYTYVNDASGEMSLGITFVLSKQYSDHLSDSVKRANT